MDTTIERLVITGDYDIELVRGFHIQGLNIHSAELLVRLTEVCTIDTACVAIKTNECMKLLNEITCIRRIKIRNGYTHGIDENLYFQNPQMDYSLMTYLSDAWQDLIFTKSYHTEVSLRPNNFDEILGKLSHPDCITKYLHIWPNMALGQLDLDPLLSLPNLVGIYICKSVEKITFTPEILHNSSIHEFTHHQKSDDLKLIEEYVSIISTIRFRKTKSAANQTL